MPNTAAVATPQRRGRRGQPFHPVDVHVGQRIRLRRTLLGMSQEKLGIALDLTFQQVQKYERGANRISASRMHQAASVLDVPVSFFFDDLATESAPVQDHPDTDLNKREILELARAFARITDPEVKKRVTDLVRVLGNEAVEA